MELNIGWKIEVLIWNQSGVNELKCLSLITKLRGCPRRSPKGKVRKANEMGLKILEDSKLKPFRDDPEAEEPLQHPSWNKHKARDLKNLKVQCLRAWDSQLPWILTRRSGSRRPCGVGGWRGGGGGRFQLPC